MQINESSTATHIPLVWNLDGSAEYFGQSISAETISWVREVFAHFDTLLEALAEAKYMGFF